MAGFWIVLLDLWLLGLVACGAVCAVAAIVLFCVYRKGRRRWQRIAAILCGAVALACAAILAALMIWASKG